MTQRATGTAAGQPTLARYLAPGRWALIMIGVVSALINLLILASPIYMMQVYDRVLSSGSVETLVALTVMVGGAFLVLGLLEAVRSRLFARHGAWVEDRLGPEVLRASLDLRRSGATRSAGGFQDLTRLRSFYGGQGIQPLFDAPWTPIFIAVVWLLHPWLGVVTIIATLVLVALAVLNEVATRKPQGDGTRAAAALGTDTEAVIRNADVVRSLGLLRYFVARWRRGSRTASDALTRAADRGSVVIGASRFVRLFAQSAVLGVGAFLVLQAELTPGGMIAASILMGRALAPVEQAIGAWRNVVAARLSQRRLARLLAAAESLPEPQTLPALAGNVELAGVTVLPPGQRPPDAVPILRNVSFKLDPGDVLGVVGPSASGKTTLCRILVGAWQPFQGKIRLDGGELRHWDPAVLGPQIGYLPQDVELFADSVRNNIARFDPEADDAAVLAAAQAADVHDMILRLKDGYNTQIGEAGAALSAGQRQRIGLARALFGNPRFLVLDEPNANLDTQGEAALMQAIERARTGGATVVLVTHRLQILSQVTKMLVLRDGQVDRFGPRDTVLAELRGPRQVPATGQGG